MIDTTPDTTQSRVTLCSTVSEASGEDPAGSAWALRRIVMLELPLPWAYNSLESRHAPVGLGKLVREVYDNLAEPWGIIAIAPDRDYSVDGMTRIVDLQQGDGIATAYRRDSYLVPSDDTVEYLRLLSFEPESPKLLAMKEPDDQTTRDFFICTHGAIDACCATVGYPMYKLLRTMADQAEVPTRVWRCTHFGGHRFAATALEAPQGRYWAHLKADMLSDLVHRSAPVRDLRRYYRGWAAVPGSLWQLAEAEIFTTTGWAWGDVTIDEVAGDASPEAGGTLTVRFEHPEAGAGEVDVEITPNGSVKTMDQSKSAELRDAPQYMTRIAAQRPSGCLDQITAK